MLNKLNVFQRKGNFKRLQSSKENAGDRSLTHHFVKNSQNYITNHFKLIKTRSTNLVLTNVLNSVHFIYVDYRVQGRTED